MFSFMRSFLRLMEGEKLKSLGVGTENFRGVLEALVEREELALSLIEEGELKKELKEESVKELSRLSWEELEGGLVRDKFCRELGGGVWEGYSVMFREVVREVWSREVLRVVLGDGLNMAKEFIDEIFINVGFIEVDNELERRLRVEFREVFRD